MSLVFAMYCIVMVVIGAIVRFGNGANIVWRWTNIVIGLKTRVCIKLSFLTFQGLTRSFQQVLDHFFVYVCSLTYANIFCHDHCEFFFKKRPRFWNPVVRGAVINLMCARVHHQWKMQKNACLSTALRPYCAQCHTFVCVPEQS